MQKGIHPVRIRGGVPDYSANIYGNKNELRKTLKRERFIELMGEGQRYYDLRRWMDAPVEEALPVYGCNVLMNVEERDLFYQPVAIWTLKTTFADKMWFWPISHTELKRNKNLTQNPGWTYND
ncbi:SusD family protein [compost metagenome]